jgi:hypothetical protein
VFALDSTGSINRLYIRVEGGFVDRDSMERTPVAELLAVTSLIAAAPDLLRAAEAWEEAEAARNDCRECDNEGHWEHCGSCSERFGDAIDLRHAAIARARGEQA